MDHFLKATKKKKKAILISFAGFLSRVLSIQCALVYYFIFMYFLLDPIDTLEDYKFAALLMQFYWQLWKKEKVLKY